MFGAAISGQHLLTNTGNKSRAQKPEQTMQVAELLSLLRA